MAWDAILDTMTFSRIRALRKRFEDCPPMDWLLAAYVGYKKPEKPQYMDADTFGNLIAMTGGRLPGMSGIHGPPR